MNAAATPTPLPTHLISARKKILRSRWLAVHMEQLWQKHLARQPPPYAFEEREEGLVCTSAMPVPGMFALQIGDIVHNARSALDHAVYQLVEEHGEIEPDRTQFPFWSSETKLNENWPGSANGMSDAALDVLRDLRPYQGGNDDLWALHRLDIIDKHRLMLTTGAAALGQAPTFTLELRPGVAGQPGALVFTASHEEIEPVGLEVGSVIAPPRDGLSVVRTPYVVPHIEEDVLAHADFNAFMALFTLVHEAASAISKLDATVA